MKKIVLKNDDLMNIEQLEQEFGITKRTQARARMKNNQGKEFSLPFYKYGKTILYSRKAIKEWLEKFNSKSLY